MIKLFEKQTADLSESETRLLKETLQILTDAWSRGRSVTSKQISNSLQVRTGQKVKGPRIRKLINWLHLHGHIPRLIASNKGYDQAQTRRQLHDYQESLEGRIEAIEARRNMVTKSIASWDFHRNVTAQENQGDLFS